MSVFETFLKRYGEPSPARKPDDAELTAAAKHLPDELIEFFRDHGVGQYENGLFRTVTPTWAKPLAEAWGEPRAADSIFLVDAFGSFIYRDGKENHLVNVWSDTRIELFPEVTDVFDAQLCDPGFLKNIMLRPAFRAASKRLGPLADDECFGFFPAIALGGDGSVESLRKVKVREHLALLAQL